MAPRFEVVTDEADDQVETRQPSKAESAGLQMLMMGMKALSQRALIAFKAVFSLITVGSVFWLFMSRPSLDPMQLILCGFYAVFILTANVIERRC
jgi:hypothetical protein